MDQGYGEESSRPRIDKMEEESSSIPQLDKWGRPKAALYTMPTEALPDDVDPQNPGMLTSFLVKAAESVDDSEISDKTASGRKS